MAFKRARVIAEELGRPCEPEDDMGQRIVLIAKLNDVFLECSSVDTRCSQQIVACGGTEALVAILSLSHPVVQVFSLRVLHQLTISDRNCTTRLCTRSCIQALIRLLANSPHFEAAAAVADSKLKPDKQQHGARAMQADGTRRLVVASVLPLLDTLTNHARFANLAATCREQLGTALEELERVLTLSEQASSRASSHAPSSSSDGCGVQQLLFASRILSRRVQRMARPQVN